VEDVPHILVADDDAEMRAVMARALARDGYRVSLARDGVDLLRALRGGPGHPGLPDMVVTDVRMPGIGGLEIVSHLRSWGYAAPILVVTAFGAAETAEDALARGATAFFSKPFDLDDLRTAAACLVPIHGR